MNRTMLEKPFESKYIKQRKGNFGKMLDYVEAHNVIQRLNDAFEGCWNYEVVEYTQMEDEVIVLGRLTAEGIVKQQFGSSKITKSGGVSICIGDDLKSAASDALKKCSTLIGVGLSLYGDLATDAGDSTGDHAESSPKSDSKADNKADEMATMSGNKGTALITKEQMGKIKELRTKLSWSADDILVHVERLFGTKDVQALNSTMGAALIAYLQNQPGNGDSK